MSIELSIKIEQITSNFSWLRFSKSKFPIEKILDCEYLWCSVIGDEVTIITNQESTIKGLHSTEKAYWIGFKIMYSNEHSITEVLLELTKLFTSAHISLIPFSTMLDDFFLIKDYDLKNVKKICNNSKASIELVE